MIPYVVVKTEDDLAARRAVGRHEGMKWCRFNDETVIWQTPEHGARLPASLRKLGGEQKEAQGDLYLVVQVGNAFIDEFPEFRVVINKGRYLAVDLTPQEIELNP